jgi:hypothetical protein
MEWKICSNNIKFVVVFYTQFLFGRTWMMCIDQFRLLIFFIIYIIVGLEAECCVDFKRVVFEKDSQWSILKGCHTTWLL